MPTPQGSEAFTSLSIHIHLWQQAVGVKKIPGSNNNDFSLTQPSHNINNQSSHRDRRLHGEIKAVGNAPDRPCPLKRALLLLLLMEETTSNFM